MIQFYRLYNLPSELFALIIVGFFVVFGLAGLACTRHWVRRLHKEDHSHNDIVGFFLAAITVFYGITLGLVTVGTWDSYSLVERRVSAEAQIIASLYHDVTGYPEPWRGELSKELREYTRDVIDVGWPLQRQGLIPTNSDKFLNRFQFTVMAFVPATLAQGVIQAEVFRQYNKLIEIRRARLDTVTAGLPRSIWALVIIGGMISIMVTLFFDTKSFAMHAWMTGLSSALLGLMIFLVATLDNPFRGEVSVGPEALERIYSALMSEKVQSEELLPWMNKTPASPVNNTIVKTAPLKTFPKQNIKNQPF